MTSKQLLDYQQETVNFALSKFGINKGILIAHSPDLGKTPTSCVIINELITRGQARYSIILAPKSVLLQWKQHLEEWVQIVPCYYHGINRKTELRQFLQGTHGVILSTYQTVINDLKFIESSILSRRNELENIQLQEQLLQVSKQKFDVRQNEIFDVVIFDEITEIKNNRTKRFLDLKQLNTFYKIGLTGTPVMNNLGELYNQIEFLQPGFLGTRTRFLQTFGQQISNSKLKDAQQKIKKRGKTLETNLIQELRDFMIRYTKEQLQTMQSNKFEIQIWLDFSDIQKLVYEQYLSSPFFIDRDSDKGPLQHLNSLRKICDFLYKVNQNDLPVQSDLRQYILNNIPKNVKKIAYSDTQNNIQYNKENQFQGIYQKIPIDSSFSVKFDILVKMLQSFQQRNCKTIIFSESLKTLDIIKTLLPEGLPKPYEINGLQHRNKELKFAYNLTHQKNSRFCSSQHELEGASRIILFSPNFNPQLEDQAIGRAWRIGQNQDVFVYKFLIRNTIEQTIAARQLQKIQIANAATQDILAQIKVESKNIHNLFKIVHNGTQLDQKMITDKYGIEQVLETIFNYEDWSKRLTEEEIQMLDELKKSKGVNFTICQDELLEIEQSDISEEEGMELISELRNNYHEENQTQYKKHEKHKIQPEVSDELDEIDVSSREQSVDVEDYFSKSLVQKNNNFFPVSVNNQPETSQSCEESLDSHSYSIVDVQEVANAYTRKSQLSSNEIIDIDSD